ncbi:hypothetical protein NL472_28030, partial [Klebsiella pneumoniae]|nr:hypothetical protein [Klebsiella pneumoniae]
DDAGAGLWQVHVHTDAPLSVLAEPDVMEQVCVRYLKPLLGAPVDGTERAAGASGAAGARTGVVACTRAPGLLEPLARTGAVVVLGPG